MSARRSKWWRPGVQKGVAKTHECRNSKVSPIRILLQIRHFRQPDQTNSPGAKKQEKTEIDLQTSRSG